jgi:hypothetical protein
VVAQLTRSDDGAVPEPATVWMVELDRSIVDVEGTLALDDDALRFTAWDDRSRTIALTDVQKVKRIIGSPVLMVHAAEGGQVRHIAFYFRKPPPLNPAEPDPNEPPTLIGPFSRNKAPSKRRQRRANASYLANASTSATDEVREWVKATKDAVAEAKSR